MFTRVTKKIWYFARFLKKETFKIMHLVLKKLAFNNAMMYFFRDNRTLLFEETQRVIILDN